MSNVTSASVLKKQNEKILFKGKLLIIKESVRIYKVI